MRWAWSAATTSWPRRWKRSTWSMWPSSLPNPKQIHKKTSRIRPAQLRSSSRNQGSDQSLPLQPNQSQWPRMSWTSQTFGVSFVHLNPQSSAATRVIPTSRAILPQIMAEQTKSQNPPINNKTAMTHQKQLNHHHHQQHQKSPPRGLLWHLEDLLPQRRVLSQPVLQTPKLPKKTCQKSSQPSLIRTDPRRPKWNQKTRRKNPRPKSQCHQSPPLRQKNHCPRETNSHLLSRSRPKRSCSYLWRTLKETSRRLASKRALFSKFWREVAAAGGSVKMWAMGQWWRAGSLPITWPRNLRYSWHGCLK